MENKWSLLFLCTDFSFIIRLQDPAPLIKKELKMVLSSEGCLRIVILAFVIFQWCKTEKDSNIA